MTAERSGSAPWDPARGRASASGRAGAAGQPPGSVAGSTAVTVAHPAAFAELAAAAAEAARSVGAEPRTAEWPRIGPADQPDISDDASEDGLILIWSDDPADDAALKGLADSALARLSLIVVLAAPKTAKRLPERFARLTPSQGAGLDAVAAAVAAHLARPSVADRDAATLDTVAGWERAAERQAERRAVSLQSRAFELERLGLREEALGYFEAAAEERRRLSNAAPDADPRAPRRRRRLGTALAAYASRLSAADFETEAATAAREAAAVLEALSRDHGAATAGGQARALTQLTLSSMRLGRKRAAVRAARQAVAVTRAMLSAESASAGPRLELVTRLRLLSEAEMALGRAARARSAAQDAVAECRALARAGDTGCLGSLADALLLLARTETRDPSAAAAAAREAADLLEDLDDDVGLRGEALRLKARADRALGRMDEALRALDAASDDLMALSAQESPHEPAQIGWAGRRGWSAAPLAPAETLADAAQLRARLGRIEAAAKTAQRGLTALNDRVADALAPDGVWSGLDRQAETRVAAAVDRLRKRLERQAHAPERRAAGRAAAAAVARTAAAVAGAGLTILAVAALGAAAFGLY